MQHCRLESRRPPAGGKATIPRRPPAFLPTPVASRAGCQARIGLSCRPAPQRGAGHSRLTVGHRCPHPHHGTPGDPVGQQPGEEGSSPVPSSAAVTDEASRSRDHRARQEVEWVSGLYDDPLVGVSPAAPTPLPASLPCPLPSRAGDEPHGWYPGASEVGRTVTVAVPPNRVKGRTGSLTLGGIR